MLTLRHRPKASISSAQKGSTGQNPMQVKNRLKAKENRQIATKKSLAPTGVSEQLGASSMRFSMAGKNNSRAHDPSPLPEVLGPISGVWAAMLPRLERGRTAGKREMYPGRAPEFVFGASICSLRDAQI